MALSVQADRRSCRRLLAPPPASRSPTWASACRSRRSANDGRPFADLGTVALVLGHGVTGEDRRVLHPGWAAPSSIPISSRTVNAGYRVISSRRGHFKSETGSDVDTFFAADDLLALMDHLDVDKFHAVGKRAGRRRRASMSHHQAERVRTLVLASSMMGIADPMVSKDAAGATTPAVR